MSTLTGTSFIGARESREGGVAFRAQKPTTGATLDPELVEATPDEIDAAARAAEGAGEAYAALPAADRGACGASWTADRFESPCRDGTRTPPPRFRPV